MVSAKRAAKKKEFFEKQKLKRTQMRLNQEKQKVKSIPRPPPKPKNMRSAPTKRSRQNGRSNVRSSGLAAITVRKAAVASIVKMFSLPEEAIPQRSPIGCSVKVGITRPKHKKDCEFVNTDYVTQTGYPDAGTQMMVVYKNDRLRNLIMNFPNASHLLQIYDWFFQSDDDEDPNDPVETYTIPFNLDETTNMPVVYARGDQNVSAQFAPHGSYIYSGRDKNVPDNYWMWLDASSAYNGNVAVFYEDFSAITDSEVTFSLDWWRGGSYIMAKATNQVIGLAPGVLLERRYKKDGKRNVLVSSRILKKNKEKDCWMSIKADEKLIEKLKSKTKSVEFPDGEVILDGPGSEAEPSVDPNVNFTIEDCGYYALRVYPKTNPEADLSLGYTLTISKVEFSSQSASWAHFSVPDLDDNFYAREIGSLAQSLMFTNTTPELSSGGQITAYQFESGKDWYSWFVSGFEAIAEANGGKPLPAKNGMYGFHKPSDIKSFNMEAQLTFGSGVFPLSSRFELMPDEGGVVMMMTRDPAQPAEGYVTTCTVMQYRTDNQWPDRQKATVTTQEYQQAIQDLSTMPQFSENPSHLKNMFSRAVKAVNNGLRWTSKNAGRIGELAGMAAEFL